MPYLNGGLFDVHDLERSYPEIQIADEAFERLFAFFDSYQWHLDERPLRADNEINPDVLGYIFEKYINQKQMGAYYTKEDITGYISRNTLIPFLFNAAEKECAIAFKPDSALWRLLRDDPDRYIYPALRKGVDVPLPEEIAAGIADVSQRGSWNKPASEQHALPTETWREHVARRQRCHDLRAKLKAGAIHDINDFITYNLDICQFTEDVLDNSEGPELLRAFYRALSNVSVLDPACGSGAFLFAALNLLEPLYEACLERMHGFLDDLQRNGAKHHPEKFADFRKIREDVERHPNRRYFILKSIIVGNLYGVDIMDEAVEICKLRLFLKLAAQVEKVEQIEPLPDIDFNVRAGNTLVGFASLAELEALRKTRLGFDNEEVKAILEDAQQAEQAFAVFRRLQLQYGTEAVNYSDMKKGLQTRLANLRNQLDHYLAGEYGVDTEKPNEFPKWKASHKPFHWFAEFYGIMANGGFDVIIGNPPYVEYSKVRSQYQVHAYETLPCGNIYTFFIERCLRFSSLYSRSSLIVPLSLLCTDRMALARKQLAHWHTWIPAFDIRPSSLFEGVSQRLCIFITAPRTSVNSVVTVGGYRRWATQERSSLIPLTAFADTKASDRSAPLSKIALPIESNILSKINGPKLAEAIEERAKPIYIHRICRYFVKALDFIPHFMGSDGSRGKSEDYKVFTFKNADRTAVVCLINSSLFYWFWRVHGDGFHCGYGNVYYMPFKALLKKESAEQLVALHSRLMKSLKDGSVIKKISTKKGAIEYQEFYPKDSKPIMDEIDRVFAKHYGFTDEELDFILNYDIKYRMGQDGGDEEE